MTIQNQKTRKSVHILYPAFSWGVAHKYAGFYFLKLQIPFVDISASLLKTFNSVSWHLILWVFTFRMLQLSSIELWLLLLLQHLTLYFSHSWFSIAKGLLGKYFMIFLLLCTDGCLIMLHTKFELNQSENHGKIANGLGRNRSFQLPRLVWLV